MLKRRRSLGLAIFSYNFLIEERIFHSREVESAAI